VPKWISFDSKQKAVTAGAPVIYQLVFIDMMDLVVAASVFSVSFQVRDSIVAGPSNERME
jgi:hypothetical protein